MRRLPDFPGSSARPWLCAIAAGCLAAGAAAAADLSPEERLQAVRQGLTHQAMQGATQVHTTAWIDEQGALREASSFRTGMQVRGVRVIAYSRDGQGQPQAQLQVQSPQDLLKGQPGAGKPAAADSPTNSAMYWVCTCSPVGLGRWTRNIYGAMRPKRFCAAGCLQPPRRRAGSCSICRRPVRGLQR